MSAENELSDYYSSLPEGYKDALPEDFENEIAENGADAASSLSFSSLCTLVLRALRAGAADAAPMLVSLMGTVLMCSLISASDMLSEDKLASFVKSSAVVLSCVGIIKPLLDSTLDSLKAMALTVQATLPAMAGLSIASGQGAGAASSNIFFNTFLA